MAQFQYYNIKPPESGRDASKSLAASELHRRSTLRNSEVPRQSRCHRQLLPNGGTTRMPPALHSSRWAL